MIKWGPIDDFMQGPKILLIKREYHWRIFIRPRPFWLSLKIWWTRKDIINEIKDIYTKKKMSLWTEHPTLEIGTFNSE